jgi:peptidoglycan hydrolase-like protein with peptidoglycan-binding domain
VRFNEFKFLKEKVDQPLGTSAQQPAKVASKERAETTDLKMGPPYPPEQSSRVKAMQTKLKDIGYGLGTTGVDGKFGPRTSAALSAFIKDYNLQGKSNFFDADLAKALDDVVSGAIARVQAPTPVNTAAQKTSAGKALVGGIKKPGAALKEPEFMKKLQQVSDRLGVEKEVLLKVMKFESNLDPQAVNSMSKATGLIQFMPNTAAGLGTSVEELYNMTATDQLDFVEKYYKQNGVRPGATVGDLYILTFMPAAANKPDNFVLGNVNGGRVFNLDASKVYAQNKIFDQNGDGIFTKADVVNTINQKSA